MLVWSRGEALLAIEVDRVVEVAAVGAAHAVQSREGPAPVVTLPRLDTGEPPRRAVVVRTRTGLAALPADAIQGIRALDPRSVAPTPDWFAALGPTAVRALVLLDDDRPAALLALDALPGPS